eukprot:15443526-Alexandrium_andersonii.AAC.1
MNVPEWTSTQSVPSTITVTAGRRSGLGASADERLLHMGGLDPCFLRCQAEHGIVEHCGHARCQLLERLQ